MLNPDYRDILSTFSDENVEFLLVGAYALAVYGLPRATGDMDLWVRPSKENAERVWRALARFGAPLDELSVEDLTTPGLVFQVGVAPRRIDILTSILGVEFEVAWPSRNEVDVEGLTVPVISRADLVRSKEASGRPQDRADIARLQSDSSADLP